MEKKKTESNPEKNYHHQKIEPTKKRGFDSELIGVKIISVFHYINSGFWMMLGFILLTSSRGIVDYIVDNAISQIPEMINIDKELLVSVVVTLGIISLGFSILNFFVARGLWKLKQWARIVSIVLASIVIIFTVYSISNKFDFLSSIRILIRGPILVYLIFCKEAVNAFKTSKK